MNSESINSLADAFLAASLPLDPNEIFIAAEKTIDFYTCESASRTLPEEEVCDRFAELWELWLEGVAPSKELKDVIRVALSVDPNMEPLALNYFKLIDTLEKQVYMSRAHAIALIGYSPLIRTLVVEQHLGLNRIKDILNVPDANYIAIGHVLEALNLNPPFKAADVPDLHRADVTDIADLFGDTLPDEAGNTFKELLGSFARSDQLGENVTELVRIGFEPYLFFLYYELLTLATTDRFPGHAIYEHGPRNDYLVNLWHSMYKPDQGNPYLNNAKSVHSFDESWAVTKITKPNKETKNGALILADTFGILSELPYANRRRVARVVRCYLTLMARESRTCTELEAITPEKVRSYVKTVSKKNSRTRGVLDQRLVDFLTMCKHSYDDWGARGLGSSVNESNASGRKFGDVEFLNLRNRTDVCAYEAHGGGLRDEYVTDHVNSLATTVAYFEQDAKDRGEKYSRNVEIVYVAHDVSHLKRYKDGCQEKIGGVSFTFRFITFKQLVEEAGGIDNVAGQIDLFDELIHSRISRLPDTYTLKKRYVEILEGQDGDEKCDM